jgi:hypothetical protein
MLDRIMKKLLLAFVAFGLLAAQEKVDQATGARFRSEELEQSQIMRTLPPSFARMHEAEPYATFSTSTAFRPPKANELESAYSTC